MFFGHSRPAGIVWTVAGAGAAVVGDTPNLDDGRPDTLAGFTWLTGTQTTASVFHLRADWTSGAIAPRLIGLSNISLPAGTKISVSFRRSTDPAGTYPYAPAAQNNPQRIFERPRGERAVWIMIDAGATPIVGVDISIWNDVDGAATIAAGTPFVIGEAVVAAGDDAEIDQEWSSGDVDSTTAAYTPTRQPYTTPGTVYRPLSFKFVPDDDAVYFGGGSIDLEALIAKLDRGQSGIYVPRYVDDAGVFSAQLLHRTAMIGVMTRIPASAHVSGPIFSSGTATVVEAPIPT